VAALLAIAALIAGISAYVLALQSARTEPVVIAGGPIAPGERIRAEQLVVIQAPVARPAPLTGIADPSLITSQYARVQISANQVLMPDLVQPQPLSQHSFANGALPAELLNATVYELPRTGLSTLTSQDQINILVLLDETRGRDPSIRVSALDTPGQGARVVRVLRNLNVLAVNERNALLEVTPAQSAYLWALQTASIPFVGELAATPAIADTPLGPVQAATLSLAELGMASAPAQVPVPVIPTTTTPTPIREKERP
jgi:hypothetical protein